jgi:hypothetical protein
MGTEKTKKKRVGCETAAESQSCSLPFRNESDLALSAAKAVPVRGPAYNLPYDIRKARYDISVTPSDKAIRSPFRTFKDLLQTVGPGLGALGVGLLALKLPQVLGGGVRHCIRPIFIEPSGCIGT